MRSLMVDWVSSFHNIEIMDWTVSSPGEGEAFDMELRSLARFKVLSSQADGVADCGYTYQ
jgi:hypothetical protein